MSEADSTETQKADCPSCRKETNCFIRCKFEWHGGGDYDGTAWSDTGYVLQCCGCDEMFFLKEHWFSEWDEIEFHPISGQPFKILGVKKTYWPPPAQRETPKWSDRLATVDLTLHDVFKELYQALNANLFTLSAIGVRTLIDRAGQILGCNHENFGRLLSSLKEKGLIDENEKEILSIVIDAGGAAAHRAWKPSVEQMDVLVDVAENFLSRNFVLRTKASQLQDEVPPRPRGK